MTTKDTLRTIFAEMLNTDAAEIKDNTNLVDLGADSLDSIEILLEVEERFDLVIDDGPWETCVTFADYAELIEGLLP